LIESMRVEADDLGYGTATRAITYFLSAYVDPWRGHLASAENALRALSEAEAQDIGFLCSIYADLGTILCGLGRFEEAIDFARRSLAITSPGDLHPSVTARAALARGLAHEGSVDEALSFAQEAVGLTDGLEWTDVRAAALRALADVLRVQGREGEAAASLRECVDLYERKGFGPAAEVLRAELAETSVQRAGGS
jgi:tetratricopeptide (TPR) repeat protein